MRKQTGEKMTVVIPVYKVGFYLRPCMDSVVNQTYRSWEIIPIDDGSHDQYGAIRDEDANKNALDVRTMIFTSQILRHYYLHSQNLASSGRKWRELDCFERKPVVYHAIRSKKENMFSIYQNVLRCLLRLPWIWPIDLLWKIKTRIKGY